jgi:hypothetical protein
MKNSRDFSKEYQARKERQKRVYADIDKDKAAAFAAHLAENGQTLAAWLNAAIDKELKAV